MYMYNASSIKENWWP